MGNACGAKAESQINTAVKSYGPLEDREGEVYVLITGIDYSCDYRSWAGPPPKGHGPLDTKYAFDMMKQLAQQCGVAYMKTLWNRECTIQGMEAAIAEVCGMCGPNDYFIFYYTGHGDQLPQDEGHEDEVHDQCLCLVGPDGCTDDETMTYRQQVWWRDDDLAETVCENLDPEAHVLVLVDACHSGSIADFGPRSPWTQAGIRAISISGCQDTQTSAGTGKGGMFTRSLTQAIQDVQGDGEEWYTVADVYNSTLEQYQRNKMLGHTQNITIHGTGIYPHEFVWPLHPQGQYVAPANAHMRGFTFE